MLEGRLPGLVPARRGGHRRAPAPDQRADPARRRARLPLLPRPRRGRRAADPGRHEPDGRDRERARRRARAAASTGSTCRSPRDRTDAAFVKPLASLRLHAETELYLGALHAGDDAAAARGRIEVAHSAAGEFGLATPCGWGRLPRELVPGLLAAHADLTRPVADPDASRGYVFAWPAGFERIPDEDWVERSRSTPSASTTTRSRTTAGTGTSTSRSSNSPATSRTAAILIDYSGGTGILLDRLLLRIFDRQVGVVIVDSSPKFLRVARRQVPRRRAGRVPPAALPEGRAAPAVRRRGSRRGVRRRTCSSRRTRSTSTTTSTRRCVRGRAC